MSVAILYVCRYTNTIQYVHSSAHVLQGRSQLDDKGGGLIFIYSCSAQLISFEIDCFYGVWTRYMNISPPPPIVSKILKIS